ncbi:hypothetical protein IAR55_000074 [Kwoniella newhampshirensis]|uniref:Uncharacterized protein n=1 Tax=Kwoniella newhampshirensis TaxID=1651941 RepID=A0AAW0Z5T3_9TREE
MSAEKEVLSAPIPESLEELANAIDERAWALAAPEGDEGLAEKALAVTKDVFDLGISLESISHPHLHPFILSILEPPSVNLRSSTKSKTKAASPPAADPSSFLPYTPLTVLTTEGLDPGQIWAQLELRTEGISKVVKEVGAGEQSPNDEDEDEEREGEDSGSDEDMTVDEYREMLVNAGRKEAAKMTDEEITELMELSDEDSDDDDDEEEMSVDEFRQMLIESGEKGAEKLTDEEITALMEDSDDGSDEEGAFSFKDQADNSEDDDDEEDEEEDQEMAFDEDDELANSDIEAGSDEGISGQDDEDEEGEEDEGEEEEDDQEGDEDDIGEELGDGDDEESALLGAGPSKPRSKSKSHSTLDDEFFSIDDFNRQTEELEAGRVTSGRLGGVEDDEEELGDVGALMLGEAADDEEISYADFFEPPRGAAKPQSKGKDKKRKGKGKLNGKGRGVRFDEDEVMDVDLEDDEEEPDVARGVMGRVKGDLFHDEDEEEPEKQNLSAHEKRQQALAQEIAQLEAEAIGPKDWTLLGEASSKARPENSLLEENLDFEQMGKVVPVITEDSVKSLEEVIKARILDNNFDSPIRVRAYDPTPFLPSRYFELQDTQSSKSLAQIYEEDYQAAASGSKTKDPRDEKLRKDHEEIDNIWGEICYKLDALSSLNFVPKQPKAQITTISDLPTTTMESALPPTSAAATMLAPEELFAPPTAGSLVARSELTPEEAQRARLKHRKVKKAERQKLGDMAELYGQKRKSTKDEKEEALRGLVKGGKGVTVIGKGAKEVGKAQKRLAGPEEGSREDGKRLKL